MINYKKCQESIKNEVLSTAKSCSSKYVLTKDALATWDDIIISMIEKRISHLLLSQLSNKCSADVISNNLPFCESHHSWEKVAPFKESKK